MQTLRDWTSAIITIYNDDNQAIDSIEYNRDKHDIDYMINLACEFQQAGEKTIIQFFIDKDNDAFEQVGILELLV